jgi:hypothetical protein
MWSVLLVEKTTDLRKVTLSQKYVLGTVLTMSGKIANSLPYSFPRMEAGKQLGFFPWP